MVILVVNMLLNITLSSADGNMAWLLWQFERSGPQNASRVTGQTATTYYMFYAHLSSAGS